MSYSNIKKTTSSENEANSNFLPLGFFSLVIVILFSSCLEPIADVTYTKIPPGQWRGILKLDAEKALQESVRKETPASEQMKMAEITEGELPFNFEVTYANDSTFYLELINGKERLKIEDISFGRDRSMSDDSIRIDFAVFDAHIEGIFEQKVIQGTYVLHNKENYRIPFVAFHGQNHRFTTLKKPPKIDLSGKWEVMFEVETSDPYPAIGEFQQNGNELIGTFRTETGDYRYLQGTVQANKLYLSVFDGAHAYLFEAIINDDETLEGVFKSGNHYSCQWMAKRNPNAQLTDANELTTYIGNEPLNFSFPNSDGEIIGLTDEPYNGVPKLIQIFGTWCPNCYDETRFLTEYLKANPSELQVLGLAFERHKDTIMANAAIKRYKKRMDVPYEILLAGSNSKSEASEKLPMLSEIRSYPTLLYVDRRNNVVKIHTGFNGPATSEYQTFRQDFHETIQQLLKSS